MSGAMLRRRAQIAMASALNEVANRVFDQSQIEVPKGDPAKNHNGETLEESGRAPSNNPEYAATPDKLIATLSYDAPYAAAQHEGKAIIERDGEVINWQVAEYTTEGTKKKYLEDPLKAAIPELESTAITLVNADLGLL